jgi:hypothetical protein
MSIRKPAALRATQQTLAAFSPLSIANCELWLDASDAGSVTLVSSAVSQWNDLSGNGRHATQGTANNRPAYSATVNGRNVITLDGTNDSLTTGLASSVISGFATIFCVCRPSSTFTTTTGNNISPLLARNSDNSAAYGMVMGYDSSSYGQRMTLNWFWRGTGFNFNNGPELTLGSMSVFCVRLGASNSDRRVNTDCSRWTGVTAGTGGASNAFLIVGGDVGIGRFWKDYIAECIVYSRDLSTSELRSVEGYLVAKWGVSLP